MNRCCLYLLVCLVYGLLPKAACAETPAVHSLVFPRTGEGLAGEILGMDDDSLTLLVQTTPVRLARADIARMIVRRNRAQGQGFITGTLVGFVGWNAGLAIAHGQPAPFLHAEIYGGRGGSGNLSVVAFIALVSTGVTGGIGHLIDNKGVYSEQAFFFTDSREAQQQAWAEVRSWLGETRAQQRVRIALSSASVMTATTDHLIDDAQRAGMNAGTTQTTTLYSELLEPAGRPRSYEVPEPASSFNLFRRLTATYTLTPSVDIGASVAWLGEPVVSGAKYQTGTLQEPAGLYAGVRQMVGGRGYYATGLYNPGWFAGSRWGLRIGGGVGLVSTEYRLDAFLRSGSASEGTLREETYHESVSGVRFGTLLLAELSYRMYDHLSIGMTADYAWTPATREIPAIAFLGIPGRTFSLSNGSVGVQLGLHF